MWEGEGEGGVCSSGVVWKNKGQRGVDIVTTLIYSI